MSEHSPLPWLRHGDLIEDAEYTILATLDGYGAEYADAGDRIVRAVNCFDELIEAVRVGLAALKSEYRDNTGIEPSETSTGEIKQLTAILAKAQAK